MNRLFTPAPETLEELKAMYRISYQNSKGGKRVNNAIPLVFV